MLIFRLRARFHFVADWRATRRHSLERVVCLVSRGCPAEDRREDVESWSFAVGVRRGGSSM